MVLVIFVFVLIIRSLSNDDGDGKLPWSWILKVSSLFGKRKRKLLFCFPVLDKTPEREIRHFHVIVVQRRQRNVQKSVMHVQTCFANLRACLHGGGGPQIGEVKCGGSPHQSCKRDQLKTSDYIDRRVTPPKRFTSPSWGPPSPCKQALNLLVYCRSRCRRRRRCLSFLLP